MEIIRYNESYMSNKIDALYKKTTLYECEVLENTLKIKREEIIQFINEYISSNAKFKEDNFIDYSYKTPTDNQVIDFKFFNGRLILKESRNNFHLTQKETMDILKYLSDIDLLRNTKKYNL